MKSNGLEPKLPQNLAQTGVAEKKVYRYLLARWCGGGVTRGVCSSWLVGASKGFKKVEEFGTRDAEEFKISHSRLLCSQFLLCFGTWGLVRIPSNFYTTHTPKESSFATLQGLPPFRLWRLKLPGDAAQRALPDSCAHHTQASRRHFNQPQPAVNAGLRRSSTSGSFWRFSVSNL